MKTYETRTNKYKALICIECDLCGAEAIGGEWSDSSYNMNEVELEITVKQKEGVNYPEGGFGKEYVIDLCPDCFKKRLVPWLISEGAKIKQKDWDWDW